MKSSLSLKAIGRFLPVSIEGAFLARVKKTVTAFLMVSSLSLPYSLAAMEVAIGDLVKIANQRENQLYGYGMVVGLTGSGDSKSKLGRETLQKVLENAGIHIDEEALKGKNTASVLVMARLPQSAKPGDTIDIWISSIGDAKSISGGYLLQTPLQGPDGVVYAVAQSSLGENKSKERSRRRKEKNTVYVVQAAIIERAPVQPVIKPNSEVELSLHHFDVTTAGAIINAINARFPDSASLLDSGSVLLRIPEEGRLSFVSSVLSLPVQVTPPPRVVIDTQTQTIVMGGDVNISPVGIAKEGITIEIKGDGAVKKGERKEISAAFLQESATVEDLVSALNRLGLSTAEIIDIIKTIHAAGALHAELVIL